MAVVAVVAVVEDDDDDEDEDEEEEEEEMSRSIALISWSSFCSDRPVKTNMVCKKLFKYNFGCFTKNISDKT